MRDLTHLLTFSDYKEKNEISNFSQFKDLTAVFIILKLHISVSIFSVLKLI